VEQTRIVLVRHGESVAQSEKIVGGHAGCSGLTERGRLEAAALRHRLAATGEIGGATALYASVMPRALETAEILAEAVGGLSVTPDCDFCEHHPGEADGLLWADADRLYPPPERWSPDIRRSPGAETWIEMSDRVARGMDSVIRRHRGETVVIVCHGGVIAHSMIRWLGLEPTPRPGGRARIEPANTSITEWQLSAPDTQGADEAPDEIQLVRFNDHAHLTSVAAAATSAASGRRGPASRQT